MCLCTCVKWPIVTSKVPVVISAPLNHHCHPDHLLFLPSKPGSTKGCSICPRKEIYHLDCDECDFVICFYCATLPLKLRYKHDEHPLILSLAEQDASSQHWCDICEEKISSKARIYKCNSCDITLHIECLLGKDVYMLPGKEIIYGVEINLLPNYRLTRFICYYCNKRCQEKIVYKISEKNSLLFVGMSIV